MYVNGGSYDLLSLDTFPLDFSPAKRAQFEENFTGGELSNIKILAVAVYLKTAIKCPAEKSRGSCKCSTEHPVVYTVNVVQNKIPTPKTKCVCSKCGF